LVFAVNTGNTAPFSAVNTTESELPVVTFNFPVYVFYYLTPLLSKKAVERLLTETFPPDIPCLPH